MNIIIAGGTGLIGTNLVNVLAPRHRISILTRTPSRRSAPHPNADLVKWDGESLGPWAQRLAEADAVINLAGENIAGKGFFPQAWTPSRRNSIRASRLKVGEVLSEAVGKSQPKPQVFIQASAVGYYGFHPSDQALTESSPAGSGFLADVCQSWENSTREVEEFGVRRVICRLGVVLDPQGGALARMIPPFRFFLGGPFGSGDQVYSWIHTTDVALGMEHLIQSPQAQGVYNFTAPHPCSNRDFAQTLGEVMGRPAWLPVPGFMLRFLFGEVASVVLNGQRVLPERLQKSGYQFAFPRLEPALRHLLGIQYP